MTGGKFEPFVPPNVFTQSDNHGSVMTQQKTKMASRVSKCPPSWMSKVVQMISEKSSRNDSNNRDNDTINDMNLE